MYVSKELAEKVKIYQDACKLEEHLMKELVEIFKEEMDGVYMTDFSITDTPSGEFQGNGEWCDQEVIGELEDHYMGTYYYPTENGKFIAIAYES